MSKMMGYFGRKPFEYLLMEKNFKAKQTDSSCGKNLDYIELIINSSKTSQELKELFNIAQDKYLCIETVDYEGDEEYWKENVSNFFE